MNSGTLRRALHVLHAITALALVASGALVAFPDLRASLVGGYGRQIVSVHVWVGIVFAAAPLAVMALSARALLADLARRLGPPDPIGWRKLHIVLSLFLSIVVTVTGFALWLDLDVGLRVLDLLVELHAWSSWVLAGTIPIHLLAARRKIASRTLEMLGRAPPDAPDWPDPSDL
jgi:cytochrome b subunit of formate dehydrogenase